MVDIRVTFDDHGLANAFQKKGGEINRQIDKLTGQLVDIAHRWVQGEAPRRTGRLKTSVQKQTYGSRGLVWLSKAIAPYWVFVIEGTRPHMIRARYKKALRIPGYGIFKSARHPGTRANPFVDKAAVKMQGEINREIELFSKWLEDV